MQEKSNPFLCVICVEKWLDNNLLRSKERLWCYLITKQKPITNKTSIYQRFPNRRPPDKRTIVRNSQKYQRHASSQNRNKGNSGRPKVVRSQQNVDAVRAELTANPEARTRRNNLAHLTKSSFNRIVKFDLKFHPFRMIIRHQLFYGYLQRRINFCNWFQARPARFFERDILIGDEATFTMDGCVNTWNVRSYAPRNGNHLRILNIIEIAVRRS